MTQSIDNKDKFKDSVFLPKTDFPMRGNLPQAEPVIIQKWQDMNLYDRLRQQSKDRKKWILHDGPPYANGNIHMGHALNKILKDVINKSWQMMGYDAPYVPGWDCHGLPIEWKIEEKYRSEGKDKDAVEPLTFRQECRDFAQGWIDIQSAQFQRLGVIGNWDDPYRTMTKPAEAQIVREIHKFLMNGGLYRGVKPVMWSTVEQTALAEAEVEYHEHKSITIWVKFPIKSAKSNALNPWVFKNSSENPSVVIWTTTPWTIPSNRAIAYGSGIEYGLYEIEGIEENSKAIVGDKIFIALSLEESFKKDAKISTMKKIETYPSSDFNGMLCAHPLHGQGYDFDVPLLAGDFVTEEAGTGFVHCAPGHGEDDFYLGMKHGIEITDNVSDDGKFRDHVPLFAGLEIYDKDGKMGNGNFSVLKALDEAGNLLAKGSLKHEYPHSWRSKAPVIYRTTPQWFIAMDNDIHLRDTALQAIKDTTWVPAKGEARITAMIQNRPDWCISRQRAWGVPIALFVHKKSHEPLRDEAVLNRIAEAFEIHGSDAWWSISPQEFLGDAYKVEDYDQIFDIVDVWFESGSTHSFVVEARKEELGQRADMYLEGSDQHRGWFHSSLLESCGTRGQAPYKSVLTHGFVLDEKGYKMSKSLGNVVDPLKIMEEHGADILRLWTMTSDYAEDIRIGKDTLKNTGDLYRRIRNTLRFLLGAMDGLTKSELVDLNKVSELPELEQLVLHQLFEMDKKIRGLIEKHEYGKVAKELHDFCNNDLSAFYFDIRKDRLYCDDPQSFERRATRSVMAQTFDCLVCWLAPIVSFSTEEAWQHRPSGIFEEADSVHMRTFPALPQAWENALLENEWKYNYLIRKVILGAIEPHRASKDIGSSLEAAPTILINKNSIVGKVFEYNPLEKENDSVGLATSKNRLDYLIKKWTTLLDWAEISVTSSVNIELIETPPSASFSIKDVPGIFVSFKKAEGEKCVRCWKVLPEVAQHADHICVRCDAVANKKKAA